MFADNVASSLVPVVMLPGPDLSGLFPEPELLCLDRNDYLYREGDLRTHAYRLEQGTIAIHKKRVGRPNHTIDMVSQGDFVGLGCYERYDDSAVAMKDTLLTCYSEQEFMALTDSNPKLRELKVDAIHREFDRRKAAILDRYPSTPVEAVAAFLCSVSRQNVHEGRNANIVTDSLKCGAVANLLGFEIETLSNALVELKGNGFIQEHPDGQIHILDLGRLERLSDGAASFSAV